MQLKPPLQVYLDSSDFSVLSDTSRRNEKTVELRESLLGYAARSLVEFRFSIVHVSETAPVNENAKEAAERRAAFIFELCGPNTLATTQEIQEAELARKAGFSPLTSGRWYPAMDELLPTSPIPDLKRFLEDELKTQGLSRAERRKRQRSVFKNGDFSTAARLSLSKSMSDINVDLFIKLQFEPYEIEAVKSYMQGGLGLETVTTAGHRLLANPTRFMGMLADAGQDQTALTDFIRCGGASFVKDLQLVLCKVRDFNRNRQQMNEIQLRDILAIDDAKLKTELIEHFQQQNREFENMMKRSTRDRERQILMSFVERCEKHEQYQLLSLQALHTKFPGIASAVAAGVHIMNKALERPDKDTLIASDFGDVMHAFYAPYVDIFRADRFMADGLRKSLAHTNTTVASKLSELPSIIETRLDQRNFDV